MTVEGVLVRPAMKPRRAAISMVVVTEAIDQELVGRAQCQAFLQVSVFILK